jgi:hypothetical protein
MRKAIACLAILAVSSLLFVSCNPKNYSLPTLPSGGTGSISLSNGPLIEAMISFTGAAQVLIAGANGPVTNAAVTLSYSGGSYPLAFTTTMSGAVTYNGSVSIMSLAYYSNSLGWSYVANIPYQMTAIFGGNTYTASVTAPGNAAFATGSSGVTCSWTGPSNEDVFLIDQISGYTNVPYSASFGPSSSNPYVIPVSAFQGYTGGNYLVDATIVELVTSAFPGAFGGSFFSATDIVTTTY